jgi:hypothetical protein
MTQKISHWILGGIILLMLTAVSVIVQPVRVSAADISRKDICAGADLKLTGSSNNCDPGACDASGNCAETAAEKRLNGLVTSIVNILSVIVGIIAVIMIIIGGLKYITSGGDSGKVSSAKSTIIYALVGLIIVALAQFIVRFVLSKT